MKIKITSIFFVIFFALVFCFTFNFSDVSAGTEHNVYGWAWSENVGWISFNNASSANSNGGGGAISYGTNIDPSTGIISGSAWSENVGWISFNSTSLTGCPTSPCEARMNTSTREFSGWARICSVFASGCSGSLADNSLRGGWDGWIRLRGTIYGVFADNLNPSQVRNWAWSDNVLGWLSLNCSNTSCPSATEINNYKVLANFLPPPPQAIISSCTCTPSCSSLCEIFYGQILVLNNGSTGSITSSNWEITSGGTTVDNVTCSTPNEVCSYTPSLGPGTYQAELTVTGPGGSSNAVQNFYIRPEISSDFMCSLDNLTWSSCGSMKPLLDKPFYFKDDASLTRHSEPSYGATISTRSWTINGESVMGGSYTFTKPGDATISLAVTDSNGHQATKSYNLDVCCFLPKWQEASIDFVKNSFANISKFFLK